MRIGNEVEKHNKGNDMIVTESLLIVGAMALVAVGLSYLLSKPRKW